MHRAQNYRPKNAIILTALTLAELIFNGGFLPGRGGGGSFLQANAVRKK